MLWGHELQKGAEYLLLDFFGSFLPKFWVTFAVFVIWYLVSR